LGVLVLIKPLKLTKSDEKSGNNCPEMTFTRRSMGPTYGRWPKQQVNNGRSSDVNGRGNGQSSDVNGRRRTPRGHPKEHLKDTQKTPLTTPKGHLNTPKRTP